MAYVSASINKLEENVTATDLQDELNNLVGRNKTKVTGSTILKVHFNDTEHEYQVKNGTVTKYEKMDPTAVYAKLYTDGTLILSSYDYTDETKEISEDYGDVSNMTDYEISKDAPCYVTGNYPGWIPSPIYSGNTKVKSVIIKDKISPKKVDGWFAGLKNCTNINIENLDISNTSSLEALFFYCTSLKNLDVSGLDTSNITNMSYMFMACSGLTSLDLSNFDTSKVTNMSNMFGGNFTDLNLSNFNTSSVTDFSNMFDHCSKLTILNLSNFNTNSATNMSNMFFRL